METTSKASQVVSTTLEATDALDLAVPAMALAVATPTPKLPVLPQTQAGKNTGAVMQPALTVLENTASAAKHVAPQSTPAKRKESTTVATQ